MPDVRAVLAAATVSVGERVDAELLLLHLLKQPRSWLIGHADDMLADDLLTRYAALIERRVAGEPVAYVIGHRGFWTLDLEVTPDTLIPRADTELLVELALQRLPSGLPLSVADLGTGSGAVALSLAKERPMSRVIATDASAAALRVARRNAERHAIDNVVFVHGHWLTPLAQQRFDLIVSNPPYIEADDPHLSQGDLRFEPASALASGSDGLDDIREIVVAARAHIHPDGWLLFEHGWHQGEVSRALLTDAGYTDVFTAQDLERRDRVSGGRC